MATLEVETLKLRKAGSWVWVHGQRFGAALPGIIPVASFH